MGANWAVMINEDGDHCVVPVDDIIEHDLNGACFCNPVYEDDIIIHNAIDHRERFEAGKKPS